MIRINLLPPEYSQDQEKKERQILLGSCGALALLLLVGFWFTKQNESKSLQKKIVEAEAELKKFKAIVAQIDNIENNKRRLTAKRDVIKGLNRSRLNYPVFFEDLLPIVPSNVWVTQVTIQEAGPSFNVNLQSNALSNFALATWLTNLQQSPHFNNVELGGINYSPSSSGPPILTFNMKFKYQHKGPMPLADIYNG